MHVFIVKSFLVTLSRCSFYFGRIFKVFNYFNVSFCFQMPKILKKILVALDFDYTLINANSDTFIYQLAPNKEIPKEIKALYSVNGWTYYMKEVFKYLHKNGVTEKDILSCIEKISLTDGMNELLETLSPERTEFIIISDSNNIFINHILKNKGLVDKISSIFTNFAEFKENGCLNIEMYHQQNTCSLSTINLCKGDILSKFVASRYLTGVEYVRIAYVGDGFNDFCPSLRLYENDAAFPRVNYCLIKTIPEMEKEKNLKLRAQVFPWTSGKDILKVLQPWYQDMSSINIPNPRLHDPGIITI